MLEMSRSILSVGIDVGTTTSQLVLSRLEMADTSSAFSVTRIEIVGASIVHRGDVGFTPFLPDGAIDADALVSMVAREYAKSGVRPEQVEAGAVIVTGESAGRSNARDIATRLSAWAGDFVATTAGADLEAALAGQGSGAGARSRRQGCCVLNLDVGGGTTNAALFQRGRCVDTWAMDVGGRLVRLAPDGTLLELNGRLSELARVCGSGLHEGTIADLPELSRLCREMAEAVVDATLGRESTPSRRGLLIGHTPHRLDADEITISGGVGECLQAASPSASLAEIARFGDVGPLLARCLGEAFEAAGVKLTPPQETLGATVIGAGSHALRLSGSTVSCTGASLPLRDVPVARLFDPGEPEVYEEVAARMERARRLHGEGPVAFYLEGRPSMGWNDLSVLAHQVSSHYKARPGPALVLVRHDFARALGQGIAARGAPEGGVVCLDGIELDDGDYIDIGNPLGETVPVVVKTLVFRPGAGHEEKP